MLNMGIYKLKYSMNLLMNIMHHFAVTAAVGVGGWFATTGRIDVGTVVAIVSGLGKLKDPWDAIVNWSRELSVVSVKYGLFADAANSLAAGGDTGFKSGPNINGCRARIGHSEASFVLNAPHLLVFRQDLRRDHALMSVIGVFLSCASVNQCGVTSTAKAAAEDPMLIVREAADHPGRLSTPPNQSRMRGLEFVRRPRNSRAVRALDQRSHALT